MAKKKKVTKKVDFAGKRAFQKYLAIGLKTGQYMVDRTALVANDFNPEGILVPLLVFNPKTQNAEKIADIPAGSREEIRKYIPIVVEYLKAKAKLEKVLPRTKIADTAKKTIEDVFLEEQ